MIGKLHILSDGSLFISTFLEIQKRKYRTSGESDDIKISGSQTSPEMLLGKNMRLYKNMHFELYVGIKYRCGFEQKVENRDGMSILTDKEIGKLGARGGFNLAYKF